MNYNFGQVGSGVQNAAGHGGYNGGMLAGRGVVQAVGGNMGRSWDAESRPIERKRKRTAEEAGSYGQLIKRRKLNPDEKDIIADIWGLVGGFLDWPDRNELKAVNKASYKGLSDAGTERAFNTLGRLLQFLDVQITGGRATDEWRPTEEAIIQACTSLTSEDVRRLLNADTIKNSLYIGCSDEESLTLFQHAPGVFKAIMDSLHELEISDPPESQNVIGLLSYALQENHSIRTFTYASGENQTCLLTPIGGGMRGIKHLKLERIYYTDISGVPEIMANNQLEGFVLDSPNMNLSETESMAVIQALRGKKLKRLELHNPHLSPSTIHALLDVLQEMNTLERLELQGIPIPPEGVDALARIVANNKKLKRLGLSDCNLLPQADALNRFEKLCKAMAYSKIRTLDLSGNRMGADGAALLAQSIATMQLGTLHLYNCAIMTGWRQTDGAIYQKMDGLHALLQSIQNHVPKKLELGFNGLGNEGAITVIDTVLGSKIQHLGLEQNEISLMGMQHIASKIPQLGRIDMNLSSNALFEPLDFSPNYLFRIEALAQAIEAPACRLRYLNLAYNNVDRGVVLRLKEAARRNTRGLSLWIP